MAQAKVKFRTEACLAEINRSAGVALNQVALRIEGRTKMNIQSNGQIDTGFMLNATYSILAQDEGSTYGAVPGMGPTGQIPAPLLQLPGNALAGVANAARYAVYQELTQSFLFRAAEQTAQELRGVKVKQMISEELHD